MAERIRWCVKHKSAAHQPAICEYVEYGTDDRWAAHCNIKDGWAAMDDEVEPVRRENSNTYYTRNDDWRGGTRPTHAVFVADQDILYGIIAPVGSDSSPTSP